MRLHSIRLQNYRGITDSKVEFADGVTVVEGPNEIGKSSIAQAIRHLREDKASSRKQGIKDIQPVGADVGPEVELHLSTGDYELRYRKRWLRQPTTELNVLRPRPEQLTSDDAHDRFLSILTETVDVDLLVALDVAQGESLEQASLVQIKALHNALSDSGAELGDHDEFLERIEEEFAKHFTKSGKQPTGEYKEALAAVPGAEEAHRNVLERSRGMDDLVDNHARAAAGLESVREQYATAVEGLEKAEKSAAAVAELKSVLDEVVARAAAGERDLQIAREALARRQKLVESLAAGDAALQKARENVGRLEPDLREQEAEFDAAQKSLDASQVKLDLSREEEKRAGRMLTRARAKAERAQLRDRLDDIRAHDDKRAGAQATVNSIAVARVDVERLSSLETDVRIAENARTAAAAQVSIERLGDRAVRVDGMEIGEDEDFAVVKELQITIDDIADITVRPGVSPSELDAAVTKARSDFEAELVRLEVDTVAQARERAQERAEAEAVLAEANSTLKVLLGKDRRADLEAALAKAVQLVGDESDDQSDEGGRGSSAEELEEALATAATTTESLQIEVDQARRVLEQKRTVRDRSRVELARAQTTAEEAAAQYERLQETVTEARETDSDESLGAAVDALESQVENIGKEVAEARTAYEASDPESLDMQLKNARQLVVGKEKQREENRQKVDQLAALIDDRASEGIYEKLAAAEQQLEYARSNRDRLERQAQAIKLLRTTVLTRKNEAQRKYVAPFRERIERLGRLIFGKGFAVEVSEDLQIVSRTLREQTVPFESLSGGTKEQLALIGRLAVATLVASDSDSASDTGAPVILDDAFGFADQERLGALNVILNDVGRSAQVILLTCQPDRFANLGGAKNVSLTR